MMPSRWPERENPWQRRTRRRYMAALNSGGLSVSWSLQLAKVKFCIWAYQTPYCTTILALHKVAFLFLCKKDPTGPFEQTPPKIWGCSSTSYGVHMTCQC